MERTVAKGSEVKFTFGIDANSLGGQTLQDVDYTVKFYAKEKADSKVTGVFEVPKSGCIPSEDDENAFFAICDTANLNTGVVYAILAVEYIDEETGETLNEKIPLTSNVKIVEDVKATIDYQDIQKLVVAGRVYAYALPFAETDVPSVTLKNGDQRLVAICTSAENTPGACYQWYEGMWAVSSQLLNELRGKYVIAINKTGSPVYYHDGTKWVMKGLLYEIKP